MHIILGALGSIVTILWILHRLAEMGIDLGGLNPWLWRRRRNWKHRYEADPVFSLQSPMEVTALLITAVAKADGDMSAQEKQEILKMFEGEFALSSRESSDLLSASAHLLGNGDAVRENLQAVLSPSLDRFSPDQAKSAIALFERIAAVDGNASRTKAELIQEAASILTPDSAPGAKWS